MIIETKTVTYKCDVCKKTIATVSGMQIKLDTVYASDICTDCKNAIDALLKSRAPK